MGNKYDKNLVHYFPHDSNARNSDKLIRLRIRHKAAGYGVFFMILERLREEPGYMSVKDYNVIAFDLREDASLIKSVVEDFGLFVFTEDGKYFYSESFNRRMETKDEKSKKRSEAGKKGMQSRWGKNNIITNDSNNDNNVITNDEKLITNKLNQTKGNETKENSLSGVKESLPPPEYSEKPLAECYAELAHNTSWCEIVTMNTRNAGFKEFGLEQMHLQLQTFFAKLQNEGETRKSVKDAMSHFARWLKIELEKQQNNGNNRSCNTSKQEANAYAFGLLQQHKRDLEAGLADEMERPF